MSQATKTTQQPTSKYATNNKQVDDIAKVIVQSLNKRYGKLLKKLAKE